MLLIHDPEERLRALDFHDFEARMRVLLRLHYGKDGVDFVAKSRTAPSAIQQALAGYFAGDLTAIDAVSVATAGTPFSGKFGRLCGRSDPGRRSVMVDWRESWDARNRFVPSALPMVRTPLPSWFLATGSSAQMAALPATAAEATANIGC